MHSTPSQPTAVIAAVPAAHAAPARIITATNAVLTMSPAFAAGRVTGLCIAGVQIADQLLTAGNCLVASRNAEGSLM